MKRQQKVRSQINATVDGLFAELTPQFELYAANQMRTREGGGVLISPLYTRTDNVDHSLGEATLTVRDERQLGAVDAAFARVPILGEVGLRAGDACLDAERVAEFRLFGDERPEQWVSGYTFTVDRKEVFKRIFHDNEDDEFNWWNKETWEGPTIGLALKLGTTLINRYWTDETRVWDDRIAVSMQSRFYMGPPEMKVERQISPASVAGVPVAGYYGENMERDERRITYRRPATHKDIQAMVELYRAGGRKKLVDAPVDVVMQYNDFLAKMLERRNDRETKTVEAI